MRKLYKLLLLSVVFASGLFAETSNSTAPGQTTPIPLDRKNVSYRVVLDPRHRTQLTPQVKTAVSKIYKRMGESFKEGDVLIQMEDAIFKANITKAQAIYEKAKTQLEAKKQLYHDNVASIFEIKEGEADLATAQAELVNAQKNLDATKVIAPYNGKVVDVSLEEHELPQNDKSAIEVVDDEVLLAKFLVPSMLVEKIKIGDPVRITVKETGETITAKVARIGSVIDPSSSTLKIEAEVDNKEGKLKTGMSGTVTL